MTAITRATALSYSSTVVDIKSSGKLSHALHLGTVDMHTHHLPPLSI